MRISREEQGYHPGTFGCNGEYLPYLILGCILIVCCFCIVCCVRRKSRKLDEKKALRQQKAQAAASNE
jgi:hypothetical protein